MKNPTLIIVLVSLSILITSCEKKDTDPYSRIVTDNPLKSHIDSLVHNTFKD